MVFPLPQVSPPLPFVSTALGSHMVLQRDKPNTFWGWTAPGEKVTVSLDGKSASGVAGSDGKWTVRLTPPKVGGPYTVQIDGSQHASLDDVLVGDVWICGGQSNMEFGLTMALGGAEAVAGATDPNIRLFMAPHQIAFQPALTNGGSWAVCTPQSVAQGGWGGFSAVGYFFGKKLHDETNVPIGLVHDNWGGTVAEAWTSREGLKPLGDFDPHLKVIDAYLAGGNASFAKQLADWFVANDPGSKPGAEWYRPEAADGWQAVDVPTGFDGLGLANFDGTAWFRRDIELTADQAAQASTLTLGPIDDADVTWINGKAVGSGTVYNQPRAYPVAAGTLHAGHNSLVVRVLDTGAFGGFSGPADALALTLADGTKLPLTGGWTGRVGVDLKKASAFPVDLGGNPNIPTVLSNGMIEPMLPLAVKGAIWYQGESNADRAEQYRRLLPAMIGDWRRRFGQGDFPFYIVSLAAFTAHKNAPGDDNWAELREAQAMTARDVKNSGLAMAIDVGDAADIHPKDKKTVGDRLALVALARDYGKKVIYQGPTYRSMKLQGTSIRLAFDHADGLVARGGAPGEFAVCGDDHVWHWATATLQGNSVIVGSPDVPKPVAVRYAWQANPVANLYNAAGLPMVPFRTDAFPGITSPK